MSGGVNPFANVPQPPNPMTPTPSSGFDPALMSLLMGGAGGTPLDAAAGLGALQPAAPPANPEEAYAMQLSQLRDMGFYDASENVRALTAARGDVQAAVEWLLSHPPLGPR
jgi:ubiquilin